MHCTDHIGQNKSNRIFWNIALSGECCRLLPASLTPNIFNCPTVTNYSAIVSYTLLKLLKTDIELNPWKAILEVKDLKVFYLEVRKTKFLLFNWKLAKVTKQHERSSDTLTFRKDHIFIKRVLNPNCSWFRWNYFTLETECNTDKAAIFCLLYNSAVTNLSKCGLG